MDTKPFSGDPSFELARILDELSMQMESGSWSVENIDKEFITDIAGNVVGTLEIKEKQNVLNNQQ